MTQQWLQDLLSHQAAYRRPEQTDGGGQKSKCQRSLLHPLHLEWLPEIIKTASTLDRVA